MSGSRPSAWLRANPTAAIWKGQFFGMTRIQKVHKQLKRRRIPQLRALRQEQQRYDVFKTQAPGSVAGNFYVVKESNQAEDAAFIGAFGAHRP